MYPQSSPTQYTSEANNLTKYIPANCLPIQMLSHKGEMGIGLHNHVCSKSHCMLTIFRVIRIY